MTRIVRSSSVLFAVVMVFGCVAGGPVGGQGDANGVGGSGGGGDDDVSNTAPEALVPLDRTVVTGAAVTLDGSGSWDPENDTLTYAWTVTSLPGGSVATLLGATTDTVTLNVDISGTYVVTLMVNDGALDSPPASVTLTAKPVAVFAASEVAADLIARGLEVVELDSPNRRTQPRIVGDYVAWDEHDPISDTWTTRSWEISTATALSVGPIPVGGSVPEWRLSVDHIAWDDGTGAWVAHHLPSRTNVAYAIGTHFTATSTHAVWYDGTSVVRRDLVAQQDAVIGSPAAPVTELKIDGALVVWVVGDLHIFAYDLVTTQLATLKATALPVESFAVRDGVVTWMVNDGTGTSWEVWGWDNTGGAAFFVDAIGEYLPWNLDTSQRRIVWTDSTGALMMPTDILVYDVATSATTSVSMDPSTRGGLMASFFVGDGFVTWSDGRNGDVDIFVYDFAAGSESPVTIGAGDQYVVAAAGGLVCWADHNSPELPIDCRDLAAASYFTLVSAVGYQSDVRIDGDHIAWVDRRGGFEDVFISTDRGASEQQISSSWSPTDFFGQFAAVVIGERQVASTIAAIFAAAEQAAVGIVGLTQITMGGGCGCGGSMTTANARPAQRRSLLSESLVATGAIDLDSVFASLGGTSVGVDATVDGEGHALFDGIDTSAMITVEPAGGMSASLPLAAGGTAPVDWLVLATFDAGLANVGGQPAIVVFRSAAGVRVLLDGTPVSLAVASWTPERGRLIYNAVHHVSE